MEGTRPCTALPDQLMYKTESKGYWIVTSVPERMLLKEPMGKSKHSAQVDSGTVQGAFTAQPLLAEAFETGCYLNKLTECRMPKVRDILPTVIRTYDSCHTVCLEPAQLSSVFYLYLSTSFIHLFKFSVIWCQNWGHWEEHSNTDGELQNKCDKRVHIINPSIIL